MGKPHTAGAGQSWTQHGGLSPLLCGDANTPHPGATTTPPPPPPTASKALWAVPPAELKEPSRLLSPAAHERRMQADRKKARAQQTQGLLQTHRAQKQGQAPLLAFFEAMFRDEGNL